jgi:hypothetical protein
MPEKGGRGVIQKKTPAGGAKARGGGDGRRKKTRDRKTLQSDLPRIKTITDDDEMSDDEVDPMPQMDM